MNNKLSVCQKNIGIWISDKKSQKLNWKELIKTCNSHGYNLIKVINLISPYCCILEGFIALLLLIIFSVGFGKIFRRTKRMSGLSS